MLWYPIRVNVLAACLVMVVLSSGYNKWSISNTVADSIEDIIAKVAGNVGIDPALALDLAKAESSLDPTAIGSAGEVGLYQIHPKYLNYITKTVLGRTVSKKEMMDPEMNATIGLGYLKILEAQLGEKATPALLLQTYNQGYGYTKKNNYQISDKMKNHPNEIYRRYLNAGTTPATATK